MAMHGLGNALTATESVHGVCAVQKHPGGNKAIYPCCKLHLDYIICSKEDM